MVEKIILCMELFLSFFLLFRWIQKESIIHNVIHKAYVNLEQAAERRTADNRKGMMLLGNRKGLLYRLEKQLLYSGMTGRFQSLTPELWIVFHLIVCALLYAVAAIGIGTWWIGLIFVALFEGSVSLLINLLISQNYNAVDRELLKFLDFLGNYSITSGEVTQILSQVSSYLEEPLKTVLEECYYEAQTSGDASLALLSMGEKVQHPKFKELVRNMEISMRYSADFTVLVSQSRKSIREHMRMRQEQKALAGEAWVNILILGAMTVVILKTVEVLIGVPIRDILFGTWIGQGCLGGIAAILFSFYKKIRKLDS
ncbi:MAG: type II secretion system F family protein [Lachnospiraceae bacterium]|nr:type II secretion system F family protein [Lachnospiraceae bacterium]